MNRFLLSLTAFLFSATLGIAQTFPTESETPITDDSDVLDPVAEAELAERITAAEQSGNADIAVVTILSHAFYTAGEEVGDYADMLAAEWDLGATTQDRWVMILLITEDRDLTIRTGPAFGDQEEVAQAIITDTMVPALQDGNFATALGNGADAVIAQVVSPVVEETEPAAPSTEGDGEGSGGILGWIAGIFAAIIGAGWLSSRRAAAKLAKTPCSSCGQTGLSRERVVVEDPTYEKAGRGEIRTICPNCGHVEAESYSISKLEKSAQKSDAKKENSGASGEW